MWFVFALAGACCWAVVNVVNSVILRHDEKHPVALMWSQSWWSASVLLIVFFVHPPLWTEWGWILCLSGVIAYFSDVLFLVALERIDASVTNVAWVMMSLLLSVAGVFLFAEHWTVLQSVGAVLIIAGVLVFSLWRRGLLPVSSLLLLLFLALLSSPFYLVQKQALLQGQTLYAVFVWPMICRECFSLLFPLTIPRFRIALQSMLQRMRLRLFLLNGVAVGMFFLGILSVEYAFLIGSLSLVSILTNVQPFAVLFFGWVLVRLEPKFAPREGILWRDIRVKLIGFCIVFGGLALLAVSQ